MRYVAAALQTGCGVGLEMREHVATFSQETSRSPARSSLEGLRRTAQDHCEAFELRLTKPALDDAESAEVEVAPLCEAPEG